MNFNLKHFVKRIPGATHTYEIFLHFYHVGVRTAYYRFLHLVRPRFKSKGTGPGTQVIAVTVSTNYSDLLKICVSANRGWFDKWIVVTSEADTKSREVLSAYPEVIVLFWNPTKYGARFDKGSGVRLGQEYAYAHYPNSWYVLLDSDIVLEGEPQSLRGMLQNLSPRFLYGISRWDYASMSDLRAKINGSPYGELETGLGFFQLYAVPFLYTRSKDASLSDMQFRALFQKKILLKTPYCSHMGQVSHWGGRHEGSRDFME